MSSSVNAGIFLGMGNPLLDISAVVKPEMLQKYGLKANDAILYEKEDIFEELAKDYKVEYMAGGATQNTMRVAQWVLGGSTSNAKATAYFGCVGDDDSSRILEKIAKDAGVDVHYQRTKEYPTGRCAVLITGHDRSLVTKLDAANHFTVDHLDPNWAVVEKAQYYYSAGFFLTVSPESMLRVARHAAEHGKTFGMNLSAPFLPQFFSEPMLKVMAYSSLVFGNETEAVAFSEKQGYDTKDIKEIARRIADLPLEGKPGAVRTVVITQGGDHPVIVVITGQKDALEFPVTKLPVEQIVDTNGAGDAFVGGFMAQRVQGKELAVCVRCGIWAATEKLKRAGCTTPEKMDFKE